MHVGHYISGMVHAGVIGWMLIGPVFVDDSAPLNVAEVSIISPEAFAEITGADAPDATPVVQATPPSEPEPQPELQPEPQPDVTDQVPDLSVPPAVSQPLELEPVVARPVAPPPEAAIPDQPNQPGPQDVVPEPPDLRVPAPEVITDLPDTVAPVPETGPGTPDIAPEASPAFAPRIAPEAAPAPQADTAIALIDQPAPVPDAQATEPRQDTPPSQRAEATTRIIPEVQRNASGAVGVSLRPRARPQPAPRTAPQTAQTSPPVTRPEAPSQPAPPPVATLDPDQDLDALASSILQSNPATDAISDALFEALATNAPDVPTGPPLSAAEADALRVAVQACWVVDVGSEAANVTVVIGISMNENGTVRPSTVRLLASEGGAGRAVDVAFQAARRAVLRCQQGGYQLPKDKYAHWKDIEITFNPKDMRLR